MPDIITCPKCRRQLSLPEEFLGRQVRCPACQSLFVPASPGPLLAEEVPPLSEEQARQQLQEEPPPLPSRPPPPPSPRTADPLTRFPRKRKKPWVTVLVLLAILPLVIGAVVVWHKFNDTRRANEIRQARRAVVNEDVIQVRKEIIEAFRDQKPLNEDEIGREIKPLFEGLGKAFVQGDADRLQGYFDVERMADELFALNILPNLPNKGRADFARGLRLGIGKSMKENAAFMGWTSFEFRNIKKLQGNEAVVLARHKNPLGFTSKMRWWVSKRQGSWKVYDWEDLDSGMRVSTVMGSLLGNQMNLGDLQQKAQAMVHLRNAMLALVQQQNVDEAERHLNLIKGQRLPDFMEAIRQMATALVLLNRDQAKEALEYIDAAGRHNKDMPVLGFLRGVAYNKLGQWEQARQHLDAYQKYLGDDADLCRELGFALQNLNRFPEAAAQYAKALDEDPKHADAFIGLMQSLQPGDKKNEVARRFALLDQPRENFFVAAEDCRVHRDGEALDGLCLAMRKIDPRLAAVDYYEALALAFSNRHQQALPLFKDAIKKETDQGKRQEYAANFLQAMAGAGLVLETYSALPDAREAFRVLAPELQKSYLTEDLRQLVDLHRRKHPEEPLLPFYEGEALTQEGLYDEADKMFAAGMKKPPDVFTLGQFRGSRVLARFHIGQVLAAYNDIGSKKETFEQLASLCLFNKKYADLEQLLDLHAKVEPDSSDLRRFRYQLLVRQGKLADGVAQFRAALARESSDEQKKNLISGFLNDLAHAGKSLDGYHAVAQQSVADAREAFRTLAWNLLDRNEPEDLRKLIDAHAQRHADDIWLKHFRAELFINDQAWDKAAQELASVWNKAPPNEERNFRDTYVYVLMQAGKSLDAYRLVGPSREVFEQIAHDLVIAKKPAELEVLIDAHRPLGGDDAHFLAFQAQAKALVRQPDLALELLQKACAKPVDQFQRKAFVGNVYRDLLANGQGLQAFAKSPDKKEAFEVLGRDFVIKKNADDLDQLLKLDAATPCDSPLRGYFTGELHLLRGRVAEAERELTTAQKQAPVNDKWLIRNAWLRARIQAGNTVSTLEELGSSLRNFEDLGSQCVNEKNLKQLEELVAYQRRQQPGASYLPAWDLEVVWLRKDYDKALDILAKHRAGVFAQRYRHKLDNYIVRCLVHLKKSKEAVKEAEAIVNEKHGDILLLVLAHAAAGDVEKTLALVEKSRRDRFLVDDCYRDLDLGPILRGNAFRAFREKHPEGKAK